MLSKSTFGDKITIIEFVEDKLIIAVSSKYN